jgi:tRNA(Ile)-lysidine synthase
MAAPLAAASSLPELSPEAAIEDFLNSLLRPTHLLAAVSGGSDSLGLLLLLKEAIDRRGTALPHSLSAATVDHGLRPESALEARHVAQICQELGIPHHIASWTGDKPKTGLPAAARKARYGLLGDSADLLKAEVILTGHTLDDQIETVAMRADRSIDGALGLTGMAPATLYDGRLWLLRPFLRSRRAAIRASLEGAGQAWIDDPSNEDPRYERVRTRRALPTIDPAVIETAAHHRQSLSRQAATWLQDRATAIAGRVVALSLDASEEATQEARNHALATLIAVLGGKPHRPGAESLSRLTTALAEGSDFRLTLARTLVLRRRDWLFMTRERRGFLPLSLPPGRKGLWDGRYIIANESDRDILIFAGPAQAIDPALPGAIRSALAGNSPQHVEKNGISVPPADQIAIRPQLSAFADFMPCWDQPLADAIARLIGTEPSPACPI